MTNLLEGGSEGTFQESTPKTPNPSSNHNRLRILYNPIVRWSVFGLYGLSTALLAISSTGNNHTVIPKESQVRIVDSAGKNVITYSDDINWGGSSKNRETFRIRPLDGKVQTSDKAAEVIKAACDEDLTLRRATTGEQEITSTYKPNGQPCLLRVLRLL